METQMEQESEDKTKTASEEAKRSTMSFEEFLGATNTKVASEEESLKSVAGAGNVTVRVKEEPVTDDDVAVLNVKQPVKVEPKVAVKKEKVEEKIPGLEDGEFDVEPGWLLMGRKVEVALSTAKGVRRLVDNEIVHFDYPRATSFHKSQLIVRISTKRSGGVYYDSGINYLFFIFLFFLIQSRLI